MATANVYGNSYKSIIGTEITDDVLGLVSLNMATAIPIIYTQVSIQKREKVQVIEAFNEAIHIYVFGSGIDVMQLNGYVYYTSTSNSQTGPRDIMKEYQDNIRAFQAAQRNTFVTISLPGDLVFQGLVDNMNVVMQADQTSLVPINMSILGVQTTTAAASSGRSMTATSIRGTP